MNPRNKKVGNEADAPHCVLTSYCSAGADRRLTAARPRVSEHRHYRLAKPIRM